MRRPSLRRPRRRLRLLGAGAGSPCQLVLGVSQLMEANLKGWKHSRAQQHSSTAAQHSAHAPTQLPRSRRLTSPSPSSSWSSPRPSELQRQRRSQATVFKSGRRTRPASARESPAILRLGFACEGGPVLVRAVRVASDISCVSRVLDSAPLVSAKNALRRLPREASFLRKHGLCGGSWSSWGSPSFVLFLCISCFK